MLKITDCMGARDTENRENHVVGDSVRLQEHLGDCQFPGRIKAHVCERVRAAWNAVGLDHRTLNML